VGRYHGLFPWR